ncbi:hypothetical protein K402DRAFT_97633 [Aulographum hederae CBS 113979]|uniref:E3 ubiquitin protein ligase n=1 Tax=Aulographum hederae CBS 113979 TaxID=1176131 RepID=A0A6G1GYL7_9PEZI|nr:hypothetical protein K402DRAFT_97633 [Aulographum hederae CBS 113979]
MNDLSTVPAPFLGKPKMTERKRAAPAADLDDAAPLKRQATSINGVTSPTEDSTDRKIEEYQREAAIRQMNMYKRMCNEHEKDIADLKESNAIWKNEADKNWEKSEKELDIVVEFMDLLPPLPTPPSEEMIAAFLRACLHTRIPGTKARLEKNKDKQEERARAIFSKLPLRPGMTPQKIEEIGIAIMDKADDRAELFGALCNLKETQNQLERATERYMVANKKIEKMKSKTVNETWQPSSMLSAKPEEDRPEEDRANGATHEIDPEVEVARQVAVAQSEKRKEHCDKLEADYKRLSEEHTAVTTRLASLSDEDYSKSSLFKLIKSHYESSVKRVNDLEASNVQIREENQKLQAERLGYRNTLDEEWRHITTETEVQLSKTEMDLTRIRAQRDELSAAFQIKEKTQADNKASVDKMKQLVSSQESRMTALQAEVDRMKVHTGETVLPIPEETAIGIDEMRKSYNSLEKKYTLLEAQSSALEEAWTSSYAQAKAKLEELIRAEESVAKASAEKAKADQKFFAAQKAKETRDQEIKLLRGQSSKSSEIVTELKESAGRYRLLNVNLEKQLAEALESIRSITAQQDAMREQITNFTVAAEEKNTQLEAMKKEIMAKKAEELDHGIRQRAAEVKLEETKVQLAEMTKKHDTLKRATAKADPSNPIGDVLRALAYCHCKRTIKNVVLKTCGHAMCKECTEERISSRQRRCPICQKAFGAADTLDITL